MTTVPAREIGAVRLARLLTELFAPLVLIFALLLAIAIHSTGSVWRGLGLGLLAAILAGGLPYLVLIQGVRSGRLGDRHLSRREERPAMMVIGLISVCLGLAIMRALGAPKALFALVGAMVAGVAVALSISIFWKISIHVACAAGAIAVLVIVLGPGWLIALPIVVAVAWARVRLRDHTWGQAVAGAIVGAAVGAATMKWLL
jgi:hypothetical protein